jgi:hypothetical protein
LNALTALSQPSRRSNYRVVYPLAERPVIEVGRAIHDVVDVSERGLRFEIRTTQQPKPGDLITGRIQFQGSAAIEVTGEVIRARPGLVVLSLESPGIPYSNILLEQRRLRSKGFRLLD